MCFGVVLALGAPAAADAASRYVDDTGGANGVNDCLVQSAPCLTVQHAVNQAIAGDTIAVAAGTYPAGALIDKANLTITGAGIANTIVRPTVAGTRTFDLRGSADGVTIQDLQIAGPYTGANAIVDLTGVHVPNTAGVDVAGLTLRNLKATGLRYAIDVLYPASATGWTVDSVDARINLYGARFQGPTRNLSIGASHFDFSDFGLYVGHTNTTPRTPGIFKDVEIAGSTFDGNATKGIYLEQGSDLNLHGLSVTTPPPPSPRADVNPNNGIDVNVKYGSFANIRISDSVFSGATDAGLLIHGRNEAPSYNGVPGSLDNVDLEGLTVTGNSTVGIAGGINVSAATTNVSVTRSRLVGNGSGGISSYADAGPASTIDATDNWWGCNEGPTGDGSNACAKVLQYVGLAAVDADPWLVLSASASPPDVAIDDGISDVTAALTSNSAGNLAGPPPNGPVVSFATDLGSVTPGSAQLVAGEAATVLSSGPTAGTAHVTASLDAAQATAAVAIVAPPVNAAPPAITGDAIVGGELSCALGDWTGVDLDYARQWLRGGTDLADETDATYTTVEADIGEELACRVTATNTVGASVNETSNEITVLPPPPANTLAPTVTGDTVVGGALACALGAWTGSDLAHTRQWQRDGTDLPDQSSASYTTVEADIGHALSCQVTATNSVGASVSATSDRITVLPRPVPGGGADSTPPVISDFGLSHRRFRVVRQVNQSAAAKHRYEPGSDFSYRLSEAAAVTFRVDRSIAGRVDAAGGIRRCVTRFRVGKAEQCRRLRPAGALTRQATSGPNTFAFSGRVDGRALRPGRYRLTLQATDLAGNTSDSARRNFIVVLPRSLR